MIITKETKHIVQIQYTDSSAKAVRKYYYYFLNSAYYPQAKDIASIYLQKVFANAEEYLNNAQLSDTKSNSLALFPYAPVDLKQKLMLQKTAHLQKMSDRDNWYTDNYSTFIDFFVNTAPLHLTITTWLKSSLPVGKMDRVDAKLSQLYFQEIGYGDMNKNRCNVFTNLANTLNINMPDVSARAFSNKPPKVTEKYRIIDESFFRPSIPVALSLFPTKYKPELLGTLLWFSVNMDQYIPNTKAIKKYNLDAHFAEFLSINANTINKTGADFIIDLIDEYLADVGVQSGMEVRNASWKRVWLGFVAIELMPYFKNALSAKWEYDNKLSARDKFIQIVKEKSYISSFAHGNKLLRGKLLNDWFKTPRELIEQLEQCPHLITPGQPEQSKFLTELVSFQGPMFQVFSTSELEIIRQWILDMPSVPVKKTCQIAEDIPVAVKSIKLICPDVKLFSIASLNGQPLPTYSPGSHISVKLSNGKTNLIRQYSLIASKKNNTEYVFAVRKIPNSKGGSKTLHEKIKTGDQLFITTPRNNFPLVNKARSYLFIAGGIGITPFISYLNHLDLEKNNIELHYAMRDRNHGPFVVELEEKLKDNLYIYEDSKNELLDIKTLLSKQLVGTHVYVCGPQGMIDAVINVAKDYGWSDNMVHYEKFTQEIKGDKFKVILNKSGKEIIIDENTSILDALYREGINHPYSCRSGNCGTCVVPFSSGTVTHNDNCLSAEERKSHIAICVSRAKGPDPLVINIDE